MSKATMNSGKSHHKRYWVLAILCIFLGVIAAIASFFIAAYITSAVVSLFSVAALLDFLIAAVGSYLAFRKIYPSRAKIIAASLGVVAVVLLYLMAITTFLQPLAANVAQSTNLQPSSGLRYWDLSTGSHIAYLKVDAQGTSNQTPIVIVGGGPGEEDVANKAEVQYFGQLARLGYNVYFYDQIGSGLSARLSDPAHYTVARQVADLSAIVSTISSRQAILMGSSWGGTLVANFMASHPEQVAKAVFTSPAPISYGEWTNFGQPSDRLTSSGKQQYKQKTGSPQFIAWYLLGKVNPRAAHNLVSDKEADTFFNSFLQVAYPGTVCDSAHLPNVTQEGNGFYDNIFTTESAQKQNGANVRRVLSADTSPVLILTGSCNYIKWAPTWQYRSTLPNSTLLYIQGAGHDIYLDQPTVYLASIKAWLMGGPLPLQPWNNPQPPASFGKP